MVFFHLQNLLFSQSWNYKAEKVTARVDPEIDLCNITITTYTLFIEFVIHRGKENGGNISFKTFQDLEDTFGKKVGNYIIQ
jgi:hypothetical protein